ncbi:MAG: GPP34 family phosphoprotein [Phycisphaerales bacterium]|nr:GPP34 family phosphoprotein [Phycisphaerales bacterium]
MSVAPFIYQQVLLLCLRDDRGTTLGPWARIAVAGGLLADLLLADRVSLQGKRGLVTLGCEEPLGDPVLDECLSQIANATRRASPQRWVTRLATKPRFHSAAQRLCDLGVLRMSNESVLLLFSRRVYPEIDPGPEGEVLDRLRTAIFTDGPTDARTAVLLSIASAAELLGYHFPKKDLRARKSRIKAVGSGEAVGEAVAGVIQGIRAAIIAASVAGAAAATG